ncbi:MAG: glycosyl hydrolase family 28-related protein [Clostridiaceae bacterium]
MHKLMHKLKENKIILVSVLMSVTLSAIVCLGVCMHMDKNKYTMIATGSLYVNVQDFGARGDGKTDDTAAIVSAMKSYDGKGGIVWFPDGAYMFSNLVVPDNITLLMSDFDDYYEYTDPTKKVDMKCCLKRLDGSKGTAIINNGMLQNIMINGNNVGSDVCVENYGRVDGLCVVRAYDAVLWKKGDIENLRLHGNKNDALICEAVDHNLTNFNISSNANGMVFKDAATLRITDGKVEWNGKNNILNAGNSAELTFDDVFLDSANWYNIYSTGNFYNVRFTNCTFIGSQRRLQTSPEKNYLSMFYFSNNSTGLVFDACYFRKYNMRGGNGSAKEQVKSLLTYQHEFVNQQPIIFSACINELPIRNKDDSPNLVYQLLGTADGNGADTTFVRGQKVVIGESSTADIKLKSDATTGSLVYDWQRKKLLINLWGKWYDVLGNEPDKSYTN